VTSSRFEVADLLEQAKARLQILLGEAWEVERLPTAEVLAELGHTGGDQGFDEAWSIRPRKSRIRPAILLIDARTAVAPSTAARSAGARPVAHDLQRSGALVLVAPWISPRAQELLESQGAGYLDLTGNVSIKLARPPIIVKTEGSHRSPEPERRPHRNLSGPRAGRLVRELVDFEGPRQAAELVERTGLSQGYVSRLLDTMAGEALLTRNGRLIEDIDWKGLLRSRASRYQLMRTGHHAATIARRGRAGLLEDLRNGESRHRAVMTGSYVAEQVAPLAVGGPLMLHLPPGPHVLDESAKSLRLLRTDQVVNKSLSGVDVILLQPPDDTPLLRTQRIEGIEAVAYSQLVLDCLTGPGRMPAEGEAVLEWMDKDTSQWRRASPVG
jgi:hypothetical protein